MGYYIRFIFPDRIKDLELGQTTTVNGSENPVYGLKKSYLFTRNSGGYIVSGGKQEQQIQEGEILQLESAVKALLVWDEKKPVAILNAQSLNNFYIGRDTDCRLRLPNREIPKSDQVLTSRQHVMMCQYGNDWYVVPLKPQACVYLNNVLVTDKCLMRDGDTLCIGKYSILLDHGNFAAYAKASADYGQYKQEKARLFNNPPTFNRSPHIQTPIPVYEIEVPEKEKIGNKPEINWLTVLLPPVMMAIIMGSFAIFMNMTTMLMTIPLTCVSAVVSVINYRSQKKKYGKLNAKTEQDYRDAMRMERQQIDSVKMEQLSIMEQEHPAPNLLLEIVKQRNLNLWRIRPDEEEFMNLRLGLGSVSTKISTQFRPKNDEAAELIADASYLENAPVCIPLQKYPVIGILGNSKSILNTVSSIVLQTAVNHSYDEVKIISFIPQKAIVEWQWLRWLPHTWDETRQRRYIASDGASAAALAKEFEELLEKRISPVTKNVNRSGAHYLFIVADTEMVNHQSIIKYLTSAEDGLNSSVIFVAESRGNLPAGCKAIIETGGRQICWYPTKDNTSSHIYMPDQYSRDLCNQTARAMAPIRLAESAANKTFPSSISFLEGYNVRTPQELDIAGRWNVSKPGRSLAVPVGVKESGEPFLFDINRKYDGPHGMVAGGTGSGKSDMVQSWILSMALHFKPTDVSFVIVDFKGDGLLAPFRRLPHLIGSISNLDHNVLRNVVALQSEIERRTALFSQVGVHNIEDYFDKREHGTIKEPLSYLIIVLDEFKDFKDTHPEFIPIVNTIYTKGASLGIYCMVLAQDAASAAGGTTIPVNSHFHWCMKVDSDDASSGMLETLDAYTMPKVPGRGFVKVGNFERYEKIQAYWSSASYKPNRKDEEREAPAVSVVGLDGTRTHSVDAEKSAGVWSAEKEIDKVIDYICDYVDANNVEVPKQLWCSAMPQTITLNQVMEWENALTDEKDINNISFAIGLIDDPATQKQYLLSFEPAVNGHIAVLGAPETGKTMTLLTSILALARKYSPDDLEMYLFDYDKNAMNLYRNLPHVKGCSAGAEPEEVEVMISSLQREFNRRRQLFLKAGVISVEGYRSRYGHLATIMLLVDNIPMACEDNSQLGELLLNIAQRGSGYGIYIFATAPGINLPYKLNGFFKTKISLLQNDKGDYTGIVGRPEILPENYPGRGLIRIGQPIEFQVALPADSNNDLEIQNSITDEALQMSDAWSQAKQGVSNIQTDKAGNSGYKELGKEIELGKDPDLGTPILLSQSDKHCLLVSCNTEAEKSNMIRCLTEQFTAMEGDVILFDDSTKNQERHSASATRYFPLKDKEGDKYLTDLMDVLNERFELYENNRDAKFSSIFIIIADYQEFFTAAEDESISHLKDIVNMGRNLGVYLTVIGLTESNTSLGKKGEKLLYSLLRERHAIFMGDSIQKYGFFDLNFETNKQCEILGKLQGLYLLGNKILILQEPEMQE